VNELCYHANVKTVLAIMRKKQKYADDYEILLMRDSMLVF
jgi:hypothetical protein